MTTHQVRLEIKDVQVQVTSSDGLINIDSQSKATGTVDIALDTATASIHSAQAILPSQVRLELVDVASRTFPLNTRYLLPIMQAAEVLGTGLATPFTRVYMTPALVLELLGKNPISDVFDLNEVDSVLSFTVTLEDGTTATITTTAVVGVLAGDLHATLPSSFNWTTGEVDINFIGDINPLVPLQFQHQYTDPGTGVVTTTVDMYTLPYDSENMFIGQALQLPVFPTSIAIEAIAQDGSVYEVYDEPVLDPTTPEIANGILYIDMDTTLPGGATAIEKLDVGTVAYSTGDIAIFFPEGIKHRSPISLVYAKLQDVIRYVPPAYPPVTATIIVPVEDWDRIARTVELALTNLETAFKYRT